MTFVNSTLCRRAALRQLLSVPLTLALQPRGGSPAREASTAAEPRADLGMPLTAAQRAAGVTFVRRHPTVDVHCHAGRFFLSHLPQTHPAVKALGPPAADEAFKALSAGHVSAAVLAGVADLRLLEVSAQGVHATREFEPGEAYADYQRQMAAFKELVARHPEAAALTVRDIRGAADHQRTALLFGVEGGDFIEDQLERVSAAFRDGVRVVTLVHYHVNQIGDIQTEPPVHHGLTPLGRDIVREMNAAGIVIDLAHATFDVVKDAVEVSRAPVILSHTNLASETLRHPRLITLEHAKLVTSRGGLVGSVPWGIGQSNVADYIDSILHLVEAVGVDHVAIGTDMDAGLRPVFRGYGDWPLLPAALMARGLEEAGTAKVMGGNFLRVFAAVASQASYPAKRPA